MAGKPYKLCGAWRPHPARAGLYEMGSAVGAAGKVTRRFGQDEGGLEAARGGGKGKVSVGRNGGGTAEVSAGSIPFRGRGTWCCAGRWRTKGRD